MQIGGRFPLFMSTSKRLWIDDPFDENMPPEIGGTVSPGLQIIATNSGSQPVTIKKSRASFTYLMKPEDIVEIESQIQQKIGQGDACYGNIRLGLRRVSMLSAEVIDSTGKVYSASIEALAEFSHKHNKTRHVLQ
jgi:hypothetical protein